MFFVKSDTSDTNLMDVADSSEMVAQLTKNLEDSTIDDNNDTTIDTTLKKESTSPTDHSQYNDGSPLNKAFKRLSNRIIKTATTLNSTITVSTVSSATSPTEDINSNTGVTTSSNNSTNNKHRRLRSDSFRTIKYFATLPFHLTSKEYIQGLLNSHHENNNETKNITNITEFHTQSSPSLLPPTSSTSQENVSDYDSNKSKKLLSINYFTSNDSNKKEVSLSSLTIWMSTELKQSLDMDVSSLTNVQSDMESTYQKLLNENLFKYFPMLDPSESVKACRFIYLFKYITYNINK